MGEAATIRAARIVEDLRRSDIYAELDLVSRSLKAQMKYADKKSAAYTVILGDSELESGRVQIKDMKNSTQTEVGLDEITEYLLSHID